MPKRARTLHEYKRQRPKSPRQSNSLFFKESRQASPRQNVTKGRELFQSVRASSVRGRRCGRTFPDKSSVLLLCQTGRVWGLRDAVGGAGIGCRTPVDARRAAGAYVAASAGVGRLGLITIERRTMRGRCRAKERKREAVRPSTSTEASAQTEEGFRNEVEARPLDRYLGLVWARCGRCRF